MTDARFPERWLNDRRLQLLPHSAFRLFVLALAYSVANRTDGVLYDEDLLLLPSVDPGEAELLAKARLWARKRDRWVIVDYLATQTSRRELEQLEQQREADKERKRAERAAAAELRKLDESL